MPTHSKATVRLFRLQPGKPTAGVGVLVGSDQLITCAHVVNSALGRDLRNQDQPNQSDLVQVEFPFIEGHPVREAQVVAWIPPPTAGVGAGDIAGMRLTEAAPTSATPAQLAGTIDEDSDPHVFGYPEVPPRPEGAWVDLDLKGMIASGLWQLESRAGQTFKAQPGYSGAPVWDKRSGRVVGLVTGTAFADAPERDAYLVTARDIAHAWKEQFDYLLVPDNPYQGLEPFTEEQAGLYFGRDRDVAHLAARVQDNTVTMLIGASGVGKSSLVQAGLIPRLRSTHDWSVVRVRPGQEPWHRIAAGLLMSELGDAVADLTVSRDRIEREIERLRHDGFEPTAQLLRSRDRSLLVVVDQFEELLATDDEPDRRLLDLLLPPKEMKRDRSTRIVLTLRADYLPSLSAIPGVGARLDERLYVLSPLTQEELRAAVEGPAAARGVTFESGLLDHLVREAGAESLAVLQFMLTRLWRTQRQETLTFGGYSEIGGVAGALDEFAEHQVAPLAGDTATSINDLLLHLVRTPGGERRLTTRQRAYESDLPVAQWNVAQRLAAADTRLVIIDTDLHRGRYAELAHESLTRSWHRLSRVIRDNEEFLDWLSWVRQRVADGDPLPDARIAQARIWLESRAADVPTSVKSFIESSETAAEARLRALQEALDRAEALRLGSDAELALRRAQGGVTTALALGLESVLTRPTMQGDLALRHALRIHPKTLARLDHEKEVRGVSLSADGNRVVTGGDDRRARVFSTTTSKELTHFDHDGPITCVAFSPDGSRVVTGSWDRSARIFDSGTGAGLARLDHERPVTAVAFSPDGNRVATGTLDGWARVFDASNGAELTLARQKHGSPVKAVAFSPDAQRVVTGSADHSARMFHAVTGDELARFDHDDAIMALALSPDGSRVVTGSRDRSSRVFDVFTGDQIARLDHDGPVNFVAWRPDGTRVATASWDHSCRVFDVVTSHELTRLGHDRAVGAVAYSPDGTRIATGGYDETARVFEASTGAELARLDHDGPVTFVVFNSDGTRVVTSSEDRSVRVLDMVILADDRRHDHGGRVMSVSFSPDGNRVATGSRDGSARVIDAGTGAELARHNHGGPVTSVSFSPDGTRVATGSRDGSARVIDAGTGAELARQDHGGTVTSVSFSPDGTRVATGSEDRSARVIDADTGAQLARHDHGGPVTSVSFSPDGTRVATGSEDRSARVIDAVTGAELSGLEHGRAVAVVRFSPDGSRVATASRDHTARVFDAATGFELSRLTHGDDLFGVEFSPEGTRVATASRDGSARMFDAASGRELIRLDHAGQVRAVAFSPDGNRLASGSIDRSAHVFDADTGTEMIRLDHEATVTALTFSPDGTRVATGSLDNACRVFDVSTELLAQRAIELMPRPLNGDELRRNLLSPNCRHVEAWRRRERQADGGSIPAMSD